MSVRLDQYLCTTTAVRSRSHAQRLIREGAVRVDGQTVTRPGHAVDDAARVVVRAPTDRVGRGADKLAHALTRWAPHGLRVRGRCLDIGASTGGFTQVLLESGAESVCALDVGRDQLAPVLASDPRVKQRPGTNIRHVGPGDLGAPFDVVVADLSFISLTLVLPAALGQLAGPGDLVALVKPQFEVGRERIGRTGVVRDPAGRVEAVRTVLTAAAGHGLHVHGLATSPLVGAEGNVEYLAWWRRGAATADLGRLARHVVLDGGSLP